jgi:hypothetical protein
LLILWSFFMFSPFWYIAPWKIWHPELGAWNPEIHHQFDNPSKSFFPISDEKKFSPWNSFVSLFLWLEILGITRPRRQIQWSHL